MKALTLSIAMLAAGGFSALASPVYSLVQGIDKFDGSLRAWHLLETNGFVVADPAYEQIFEPYLDNSLPAFITTDSAWYTYQALLSAGVKQMELRQIPWRSTNSGLEFLAGCPELRSPAAERAWSQISAMKNLDYTLPSNSLAAESLRLLATLQQPLPDRVPPALRSEAWAEKQLWTQLAGCIEQTHRSKSTSEIRQGYEPGQDWPKSGVVAPYPDFFAGLAKLSREAAAAMEKAGMDETFNTKALAQRLLDGIYMQEGMPGQVPDETEKMARKRAEFSQFFDHYSETHPPHGEAEGSAAAAQQLLKDLEATARRCLNNGVPSKDDAAVLRSLFDQRLTSPRLLRDFANTCDKLAELAQDYRDGKPVTSDDQKWMTGYGLLLAGYCVVPGEGAGDLCAINALGTNAAGNFILWAGLGRPEALYIILPADGRLQLYRGAVMTYREFSRPASNSLDDKSWQEAVRSGTAPPPPAFTADFRAEKSALDILDTLNSETRDSQGYQEIQQSMEALQSRVTDGDLPALIGALAKCDYQWGGDLSGGIAAAISKLNWKPRQKELLALVDTDEGIHTGAVLSILLQHPEWLDAAFLNESFERSSPRSRRVFTLLLGRAPGTGQSRATLLRALRDDSPAVRWQAVLAIGDVPWNTAEKISPLVDMLSDSNEFVGAVAAVTLGKIGATNAAPVLFANLQQRLQARRPGAASLDEQMAPLKESFLLNYNQQSNPFDPGALLVHALAGRMRRFGVDPRQNNSFTIITALVEALGELNYQPAAPTILGLVASPDSAAAAATALKKLAPAELTARLLSVASDKNAPAQSRDEALILFSTAPGANASDLVSLLDDHTVIPSMRPMPGREWRICDRAATTLAALLGRTLRLRPMMPAVERDQQIDQVRQWLKSAY